MLKALVTQDSEIEYLFCGAPFGSEISLFSGGYFSSWVHEPAQDDFQHTVSRTTDEAGGSVVLAEL